MSTLLCLFLAFDPAAPPVPLSEIEVELPGKIAGIKFTERHDYEARELGYSVHYMSFMCRVTLYVYDRGMENLPEGPANERVKQELDQSRRDLKEAVDQGVISNLKFVEADPKDPKAAGLPELAQQRFSSMAFTFELKGEPCKGTTLITSHKGKFFKVRVTQYVVDGKTNDEEIAQFLTTVAKALPMTK